MLKKREELFKPTIIDHFRHIVNGFGHMLH